MPTQDRDGRRRRDERRLQSAIRAGGTKAAFSVMGQQQEVFWNWNFRNLSQSRVSKSLNHTRGVNVERRRRAAAG